MSDNNRRMNKNTWWLANKLPAISITKV